jgi:hypothetical protein
LALFIALFTNCAFDLSHLKQVPTQFEPTPSAPDRWILLEDAGVALGTGFPTQLRKGTHWAKVGRVPQGDVFRTRDQLVTVEASNVYEAMVVMKDDEVVGFYLPVERGFAPASNPVTLKIAMGPGA